MTVNLCPTIAVKGETMVLTLSRHRMSLVIALTLLLATHVFSGLLQDAASQPADMASQFSQGNGLSLEMADDVMVSLWRLAITHGMGVEYLGPLKSLTKIASDHWRHAGRPQAGSGRWELSGPTDDGREFYCSCQISVQEPAGESFRIHSLGRTVYLTVHSAGIKSEAVDYRQIRTRTGESLPIVLAQLQDASRRRALMQEKEAAIWKLLEEQESRSR